MMTLLLLLKSMLWTRLWYVAHRICLCPAQLCWVLIKTIISVLPLSVFPVPTRVSAHNKSLLSRCWINDGMFSYMCITGGSQSCVPWPYPPWLTLHVHIEAVLWHLSCPPHFRASFCRHSRSSKLLMDIPCSSFLPFSFLFPLLSLWGFPRASLK